MNFFLSLSFMIILTTAILFLAKTFNQPFLLAYILTGAILKYLQLLNQESLEIFAELGIVFLFFVTGIESEIVKFKKILKEISLTTTFQVFFIIALLFFALLPLGSNAIFLAIICAFSSTSLVLKILSDRDELNSIHGRLIIGLMLLQDILVVFILPFALELGHINGTIFIKNIFSILLLFLLVGINYKISPILFTKCKDEKIKFLLTLSYAFIFMILAHILEFPYAIGAFLGGLSLSSVKKYLIHKDIIPLRDFFSALFFISLGGQIQLAGFSINPLLLTLLFITVFVLKPLIYFVLISIFGFGPRIGFLAGISMGQIGEFSFIFAYEGLKKGLVSHENYILILVTTILTMAISPYLIYGDRKLLKLFEKTKIYRFFNRKKFKEKLLCLTRFNKKIHDHIVLVGGDSLGAYVASTIHNTHLIVVDHDPEIIKK